MLTTVRQIGNSKGVLIPAAFLASCQIGDQADMQLQDGQIVIKPVKRNPREGWFLPASQVAEFDRRLEQADLRAWESAPVSDDSEWVW